MVNKDRVFVEIFHRDQLSLGEQNRQRYGQALYHWAILIRPKEHKGNAVCTSFDVTDGIRLDPATRTNLNPTFEWWFRERRAVNPLATAHFLGALMIGKLPKGKDLDFVRSILSRVSLPLKSEGHNCVTWTRMAIEALQSVECAEPFDVDEIMKDATAIGDEVMQFGPPSTTEGRFRNATKRPM